jgi:hypothetical protein
MTDKQKTEQSVDEMRAAITALTGRTCLSKDSAHLKRRLKELQTIQAAGKNAADATVVVSISMHGRAKTSVARIAQKEGIGVSELIRRALGEWSERNGYKTEAPNFEVSE